MSMHVGLEANYNNIHPHARCTVDDKIAGVFYNSEDRISGYIGREFELDEYWNLEIGLVTGYKTADVLPMVRYKAGGFSYAVDNPSLIEFDPELGCIVASVCTVWPVRFALSGMAAFLPGRLPFILRVDLSFGTAGAVSGRGSVGLPRVFAITLSCRRPRRWQ